MGLWDRIKSQFIEIIEWVDDSHDILVYKFPVYANEIKMGAKLTVREGQNAVFVNEGRVADVFPPGMYTLSTQNMPVLSTLMGWKYGFESPFKSDIYFVSIKEFTDQKWGTQHPVIVRDPEIGPVRLRAFGSFTFRLTDPAKLIRKITGTNPLFTVEGISGQLKNFAVTRFADYIASAKIPLFDLTSQYNEMGDGARSVLSNDFGDYGIEIPRFLVENVSVPPEVEKALDARSQMNVVGNLDQYTKFQTAQAISEAAANPGGMAGAGVGMGAGFAMGQQMVSAMQAGAAPAATGPTCAAGHRNAPGAKFCGECGGKIGPALCAKCGGALAAGSKFCSGCGTPAA